MSADSLVCTHPAPTTANGSPPTIAIQSHRSDDLQEPAMDSGILQEAMPRPPHPEPDDHHKRQHGQRCSGHSLNRARAEST